MTAASYSCPVPVRKWSANSHAIMSAMEFCNHFAIKSFLLFVFEYTIGILVWDVLPTRAGYMFMRLGPSIVCVVCARRIPV